jgi:hypothetical protein
MSLVEKIILSQEYFKAEETTDFNNKHQKGEMWSM